VSHLTTPQRIGTLDQIRTGVAALRGRIPSRLEDEGKVGRDLLWSSIVAPRPLRSGLASNAKSVLSATWLPVAVVNPTRTTSSITAGSLVDLLAIEGQTTSELAAYHYRTRFGGQPGSRTLSYAVQARRITVLLVAR
jgi:hypothetical protein